MSTRFRFLGKELSTTLIVSVFVLQLFFFAPLQVLIQNFGEFSIRFADVLMIHLVLSLVLIVLLYQAVRVLKAPILLAGLTYLSSIAFLESRFFLSLAQHHPFDGKPIDWAALQWLSWVEIAVLLILGIGFVATRRQTKLLSSISAFILFFLTAGFIFETASNFESLLPRSQIDTADSSYLDQFYRLSSQRNVIHIVPDQAQGAMLHDILASDYERYSGIFDGFTLFTQAVGRYKSTYPSVLYYMSGEAPEPESDLVLNQPFTWKYIEETLKQRSIVTLLSQNDFRTFGFQFHPGIFCKEPYTACTGTHDEVFGGVAVKSPQRRLVLAALTAVDMALFQMTPIVLRERIYANGHWFLRKLAKGAVTHSGVLDLLTQQMQVDENPGTYNYIHHAGAHAPLLFDRNCKYTGPQPVDWHHEREQVMCTLKQLEKMIRVLKDIDVYDQTMIVINGDHGTPWLPASYPVESGKVISKALIGMASTLILIKPPEKRGPLSFSDKPVTIGDIPATIAGALELENDYSGVQMLTDNPAADRDRQYYTYESASKTHNLQALPNMTRYRIRGNVFDEGDWRLPNSASVGKHPSQLRMDHSDFDRYAQGFSHLEQHDVPVRWVDGKQAKVFLQRPQGPVALVFDSYVPGFIDGQWMEVSVGGRIVAKLDENDLKVKRHILGFPDDLPAKDVTEIGFTLGKAVSTDKDQRQLSIVFTYIGLVPMD